MTIKLSSLRVTADLDVAGYVRAAGQKTTADASMVASSLGVGRALAQQDVASDKASTSVQKLSRMWISGYSDAAKFEKAVREIGSALDRGMDPARATTALDGVYRKFGQTADAATLARQGFVLLAPVVSSLNQQYDAMAESARRAADAQRQFATARDTQTSIASRLGIDRQPYDARGSASAFEAEFARQNAAESARLETRLKGMMQTHLPMDAEMQRSASTIADINQMRAKGLIDQAKMNALLASEASLHDHNKLSVEGMFIHKSKYGNGGGLARHEAINLSRQIQDVVVSLQGGQAPATVLLQQGSQIFDIFSASSAKFSDVFRQALGLLTPARVAIGGVASAVLLGAVAWNAYANSQKAVEVSLMGIGRGSGMTVAGINAIAESVARVDQLSVSAARSIASAIAGTGKVDSSLISGITKASYGYGILTGKDANEAGKDFAAAFADPTKGAETLNERLGFLTGSLRDYIRNAQAAGDRTGAQRALFEAMKPALADAERGATALGKAWHYVSNMASDAFNAIGRAISGPGLASQLASVEAQINKLRAAKMGTWGGTLGLDGRVQGLETNRDRIRVEMDYEERKAKAAQREQAANELSLRGNTAIRSIVEDIGKLEGMKGSQKTLQDLLASEEALAKLGLSAEQARAALGNVNGMLAYHQTAAQRAATDGQLNVQQIMAYTLAQRVAIESQRAYIEAMRATGNAALAAVEAENARNRVIAEANRQARDALRDANYDAKLVGLSPFQRGLQQIENKFDRMQQQYSGNAQASQPSSSGFGYYGPQMPPRVAAASLANSDGLNEVLKERLSMLFQQFPGLSIRSGFRSYEEQARLYAEKGPGWAAPPGRSNHERGLAADLQLGPGMTWAQVHAAAATLGVSFPLANRASKPEAWHAEVARGVANDNARGGIAVTSSADIASARSRERLSYISEQEVGPINSANLALKAQEGILGKLRQTIGATPQETARLNAEIDIMKQNLQSGAPITDKAAAAITAYGQKAGSVSEAMRSIDFGRKQLDEIKTLERDVTGGFLSDIVNGLRRGENGWKLWGNAAVNALTKVADKSMQMMLDQAFFNQPGGGFFGSLFKGMFGGVGGLTNGVYMAGSTTGGLYANGGAFSAGNVIPFAKGGITDRPTYFPMSGGRVGLMGEAGEEAILPLSRGANGKLGVTMSGARGTSVTYAPTINVGGSVSPDDIAAIRAELRASEARVAQFAVTQAHESASMPAMQKKQNRFGQ
jgi:phage-related minor tail protein